MNRLSKPISWVTNEVEKKSFIKGRELSSQHSTSIFSDREKKKDWSEKKIDGEEEKLFKRFFD